MSIEQYQKQIMDLQSKLELCSQKEITYNENWQEAMVKAEEYKSDAAVHKVCQRNAFFYKNESEKWKTQYLKLQDQMRQLKQDELKATLKVTDACRRQEINALLCPLAQPCEKPSYETINDFIYLKNELEKVTEAYAELLQKSDMSKIDTEMKIRELAALNAGLTAKVKAYREMIEQSKN